MVYSRVGSLRRQQTHVTKAILTPQCRRGGFMLGKANKVEGAVAEVEGTRQRQHSQPRQPSWSWSSSGLLVFVIQVLLLKVTLPSRYFLWHLKHLNMCHGHLFCHYIHFWIFSSWNFMYIIGNVFNNQNKISFKVFIGFKGNV